VIALYEFKPQHRHRFLQLNTSLKKFNLKYEIIFQICLVLSLNLLFERNRLINVNTAYFDSTNKHIMKA